VTRYLALGLELYHPPSGSSPCMVIGRRLVCEGILGYVGGYSPNFALAMADQGLPIHMHV